LKLESDWAENSKNHEEEVKMRMRFESKLNDMHGWLREAKTDRE